MPRETSAFSEPLNRRQFLARVSAATMFLGGHGAVFAEAGAPDAGRVRVPGDRSDPRILELELETAAQPEALAEFYGDRLELPVRREAGERLRVTAGATEITFRTVAGTEPAPFYHFAFNIPENKILAARSWQLERSPLFLTPENLRDPEFPDDVRHFRNWNAHSVFFWDPAGNVVEYIARHDLGNYAAGGFSGRDVLYASEIAFIVDDVPATGSGLEAAFSLPRYKSASDVFHAAGDERGLLLVFKRGREIGDPLRSRPAPAAVFRTGARIQGAPATAHSIDGYPYEIVT